MKALPVVLALAATLMASAATAADKTLTAAEKAAGWMLLFDGKTTAGWRGFKTTAPDPGWKPREGALGPDPKSSTTLCASMCRS